jgi:helicase
VDAFPGTRIARQLSPIRERFADYYMSLVTELYDLMREHGGTTDSSDWALLGNALADIATRESSELSLQAGVSLDDARLFGSTAFYFGGFPASAQIVAQGIRSDAARPDVEQACVELLTRPGVLTSPTAIRLVAAIRSGEIRSIDSLRTESLSRANAALLLGPAEWIPAALLHRLLDRLAHRNVRASLPDGASAIWDPLVTSLLAQRPPVWEFFPSQMQAIQSGLLTSQDSFTLQMPTGAGKTALAETLLFHHARANPGSAAVLIVPYRSLAAELRHTMVRRLRSMGVATRSSYGGSVPIGDETRDLDDLAVLVATPETLSGLLGANDSFYRRISLVICDEGHLLDSRGRGVALELLLARLKGREGGSPRFVFISAIVPNVDEINSWLGGSAETVVVSNYKPAIAEFALLRDGPGTPHSVDLVMHPEIEEPTGYSLHGFLSAADFQSTTPRTRRPNTYAWASTKTRAMATARKMLALGPVAVFAAAKGGNQGAIGLGSELIKQLQREIPLPKPIDFADTARVSPAHEYLEKEFGSDWIGTLALGVGAVLHHGDIPQETREVLEFLVRSSAVALVICTTTLAEGVNLPIRTLVLYTTRRGSPEGRMQDLLTRDIKNLVGRAGRPGASTRGLVVCANESQWPIVRNVALQQGSEPVRGALYLLLRNLRRAIARQPGELTNGNLEATALLHPLVDGIDATLIDLVGEEVGEDQLIQIATRVAGETFASVQADEALNSLLQSVFSLRATRVIGARAQGRLAWIRATGARLRHVDAVVDDLLPRRTRWDDVADPLDQEFVQAIFDWAWDQSELLTAVRLAYRLEPEADIDAVRARFYAHVAAWLGGNRIAEISAVTGRPVDEVVRVQASAVSYALQTLVEQAVSLLETALISIEGSISPAVRNFPEHLRYGVPSAHARRLSIEGLRHRSAAVALGDALAEGGIDPDDGRPLGPTALAAIDDDPNLWERVLGSLVVDNTRIDLTAPLGRASERG